MITQLTGVLVRMEDGNVVLDVGGVGYQITAPAGVLAQLPEAGQKVTLLTHLILRVQPDAEMTLYGFSEATQRQVFRLLLNTSGVGPKVALALLSTLDVSELARALSTNDVKAITKVPGVGPKLAQKLCFELGDKMAEFVFTQRADRAAAGQKTAEENAAYEDAVDGLVGLGYSRADARRAVERVLSNATERTDAGNLISLALRLLTK